MLKKFLGAVALAMFASTAIAAPLPPLQVSGSGTLTLNDAGTYTGTLNYTATPIYPDATFPDATFPDALPPDLGVPDTGIKPDSGVPPPPPDAGVPDSGLTSAPGPMGIYEPPLSGSTTPHGAVVKTTTLGFTPYAPGITRVEPDFGTTIAGGPAGTVSIYSQSQAFTSDDQFILLARPGQGYFVYTFPGLVQVAGGAWNDPKLIPNTHHIIHYDWSTGAFRVLQTDLDNPTAAETTLITLPEFPIQPDLAARNASFEDITLDGRYATVMGQKADQTRWLTLLDLVQQKAVYEISVNAMEATGGRCAGVSHAVDWFAASPDSKFLVIGWAADGTTPCSGAEVFDLLTGTFLRNIYAGHQHGDLGHDATGKEIYVSWVNNSPQNNNYGAAMTYYLDGSPAKLLRTLAWGDWHFASCRGVAGECLITSEMGSSQSGPSPQAFDKEIWLANLADGSTQRLAHHRSNGFDGYWALPKASISHDGRYAVVSTDYGASTFNSFVIELPQHSHSSTGAWLYGVMIAAAMTLAGAIGIKVAQGIKKN